MNEEQTKRAIRDVLAGFSGGEFAVSALQLFAALGYESEKRVPIEPNTAETFLEIFGGQHAFNREQALTDQWISIDLLFQLADDDLRQDIQPGFQFDSQATVDQQRIESYLVFAVELRDRPYTRSQLAAMTREINKLFLMPAMVLFKYGPLLTLAVIDRRLHKRDANKDVLEKVTLIKDIHSTQPHRAHIEILWDLSLAALAQEHRITHFVALHSAWQKTLDSSALNKRFFQELANWYFWAVKQVRFPVGLELDEDVRNAENLIRLITRLMFVWFLKERHLVPDAIFNRERARELLTDLDDQSSSYYKAILQNLFFATLNTEMQPPRQFRGRHGAGSRDGHYMVHNLYRYEQLFRDPAAAIALLRDVPFLNGGLFECLDRREERDGVEQEIRIDGFSDHPNNPLKVPNVLFFGDERRVDLNAEYGTRGRQYPVRGLIHLLNSYKFTIDENTPIEEEVALDPELLGRVFENLLAAYNPETGTTARKQTGSFYTPREIVNYMVDESLIAYLRTRLLEGAARGGDGQQAELEARLRTLFAYTQEDHGFRGDEITRLIAAIDDVKILDPACGSGAFPMGVLHKLVFILHQLDPRNQRWKEKQIEKAERLDDAVIRERTIADIEQTFARNELDYGRKLYLIENCIYGVDIQPIAVQIAKLRCFISLIVDQRIDDGAPNRNIRPLPNLETKFVAANALIGLPTQGSLRSLEVVQKEDALAEVRRRHFTARSLETKRKYRRQDQQLREEIGALLKAEGMAGDMADQLAGWNPYNQHVSAGFFDAEWMFGARGFDIVIGNPPYVRQEQIGDFKPLFQKQYSCYTGTADLYVYFYERGIKLLNSGGTLSYISSNKYFRAGYGAKLRRFLSTSTTIDHLIDFGDAPVFTAIAYPSIITTRNTPPVLAAGAAAVTGAGNGGDGRGASHMLRAMNWQPGPPIEEFPSIFTAQSFVMPQRELTGDGWRLEDQATLRLLEKLRRAGTPLGTYVNGRFYYGIKTGFNEAFVVDRATRDRLIAEHPSSAEVLKPFLRGRDVKRWRVNSQDLWLIFTRRGIDITKYPAIHRHLAQYKDRLMPGVTGGRKPGSYRWYEIQDNVAYWQEFEQPKIILGRFMNQAVFAFDQEAFYHNDALYMIAGANEYVVAILNSVPAWWFLKHICTDLQNGYLQAYRENLFQIPIPNATAEQQAPIVALVERILAAKRESPAADVTALEQEIDRLVYALYGLDADEIAVVEAR